MEEEIQQPAKKSKAWIWVLVVLLLIAGGITAYVLLTGGDIRSIIPGSGSSIPSPPALPK